MKRFLKWLYDWSQTPWGDGILGISMLCAAWAVIYLLGWLLMP